MKITKAQNPHGVRVGQVWADRDSSRTAEFKIMKILAIAQDSVYAEVYREKTKKTVYIRLDRFNKYYLKRG